MLANKMMSAVMTGCGIAVVAAFASSASGAIVYSGEVNEPIDSDGDSLFVNVVTDEVGSFASPGYDFSIQRGDFGFGDWQFTWNDNGLNSNEAVAGSGFNSVAVLSAGETINAADGFTGGGTNSAAEFSSVDEGFFGFYFYNEVTDRYHFGWGRVSLPSGDGTLIDYAYESQAGFGIEAGAGIPEPTSLGLLAIGGLALVRRR